MRRRGPPFALAPAACLAAAATLGAVACSGDHSALAARPETTSPRDAATADADDDGALADARPVDDGATTDADAAVEAAAPHFAATLVNGLADATAARFCFGRVDGATETPVAGLPAPSASAGLAFGASTRLAPPPGVDAATTALRLHAFVGDLAALGSRGCDVLLADDAGVGGGALALPVLPPGTLAGDRSVLLVAAGCSPGHADAASALACGSDYSASSGNATLFVVATSRAVVAGRLALQALHASAAMGPVSLALVPDGALGEIPLVASLGRGALGPRPPLVEAAKTDLGPSPAAARLSVRDPFTSLELASLPLGAALTRDGGAPLSLDDGSGYALVLVGAQPTLTAGGYGNATTLAVVPSDP